MTCQAGMLSIDGRCATFDEAANGIARGEGVGAVVLKRLSDAKADGDNVLAIIRGSAVNQDGRSATLTTPNGLSQEDVIRRALHIAGLEGKDVDYFECHGTGTTLGDPIEIEAIKNVLGENRVKPLVLGSVKTNIGHLEGAAGIVGLIKVIEVLKHRKAPGNVHFKTLNSKINLDGFNAIISDKSVDLGNKTDSDCLIAAVSSFGYGGTNAHVVLESCNGREDGVINRVGINLFNSVSLPWGNLGENGALASNKFEDIYALPQCLFETSWEASTPTDIKLNVTSVSSCLVVSRNEITVTFPKGWEVVQVLNKTDLEIGLSKSNYETLLFISNGTEEDINLWLYLLQLIGKYRNNYVKKIWLVTEFGNIHDAGLLGLARTFRMEYPKINLQCLSRQRDVDLVIALEKCMKMPGENEFLSDKYGNISVLRLKHSPQIDIDKITPLDLNTNGSYIISGGLGEIGLVMADLLVQCGAKYILLLSRDSIKPEVETKLNFLRKHATVEVLTCDVSKLEDVMSAKQWLENIGWPVINGIIHAAGVLSDGLLQNQSSEKMQMVYASKVDGACNLRLVFKPAGFTLLFSSTASTFGAMGQGNYVAANSSLDALALKWSSAGEQVLSIQWGAWSEVGMAVRHVAVQRMEEAGFGSISNSLGKQIVFQLLSCKKRGVVCASPIDWNRLQLSMPLTSLLEVKEDKNMPMNIKKWTLASVEEIVRGCVVEFISTDTFETNYSFMEAGLSSLDLVQFRQKLIANFPSHINLPVHFAFNYPTVQDVVQYLFEQLTNCDEDTFTTQQTWTCLREKDGQIPVFLVGGIVGSAERAFGTLADALSSSVYAYMPVIPAELGTQPPPPEGGGLVGG